MTKELVYRFIESQQLAVLGTVSPEGKPQSALMGIAVTPNFEIIFDTVRSSRKYRNLIQNPAAAFVIGCNGAVSIQYEGEARELMGAELAPYQEIYFAKWPQGRERLSWPEMTYIVVKPRWIRYMDYGAQPRVLEELAFPAK